MVASPNVQSAMSFIIIAPKIVPCAGRVQPALVVASTKATFAMTGANLTSKAAKVHANVSSPLVRTSHNVRRALLVLLVIATCFAFGCGPREREKRPRKWDFNDGGIIQLPECSQADYDCGMDCYVRQASPACDRCCIDQAYVCNTGHKADFESCKGSR